MSGAEYHVHFERLAPIFVYFAGNNFYSLANGIRRVHAGREPAAQGPSRLYEEVGHDQEEIVTR